MILPPGDTAQCLGTSVIVMTGGSWHPVDGAEVCPASCSAQDGTQGMTYLTQAVLGGDWSTYKDVWDRRQNLDVAAYDITLWYLKYFMIKMHLLVLSSLFCLLFEVHCNERLQHVRTHTHTHTHSLPRLGSIQPSLQPSHHLQEITAIQPTLQLERLRPIGAVTSKAAKSLLAALRATPRLEQGREGVRRVEEVLVSSFQITGSEPHSPTEVAQPASPRAWGV